MIVMKFGGSSVESAAAIERVASIVKARVERRPVVVVSAMGKTTNKLLAIAQRSIRGDRDEALAQLQDLREFHTREARPVILDADWPEAERIIDRHFQELTELVKGFAVLGELSPRSVDAISSYGERLSSALVALAFRKFGMDSVHFDSRKAVVTDGRHTQAAPIFPLTYARLAGAVRPLAQEKVVVMGGFIGSTEAGVTTTLGRGGSDFSASIVGAGIGAEEIQIWTDVDGMLTADPTIFRGGHRVKTISFAEAVPCSNVIKSIACKRKITVVNINSTRMLMAHGFLRRIFEVFDRHLTPVDVVSTSEVSVSLTIDNTARLADICQELSQFSEVDTEENRAIICMVGDNIRYTPGVAGRAFRAVDSVNIRMISQGASRLNLTFVVAERDLARAVEMLHTEFFRELDPAVFD